MRVRVVWVSLGGAHGSVSVYHDDAFCKVKKEHTRIPTLEPQAKDAGLRLCERCEQRRMGNLA